MPPSTPAKMAGTCLARYGLALVAQIFNLLYRRIVFGRVSDHPYASASAKGSQSATLRYSSDTAEYNSALRWGR